MTNAKNIIQAAYARSTANEPDKLATDAELIAVIDRRLKSLFSFAARFNPYYFGKSATQAYVASTTLGWPRPTDAELVIRIEDNSDNSEIHVVPFSDKEAEHAPRVFEFGQVYKTVGTANDPATTDTLLFYYSKRPADLDPTVAADDANNTIDSMWPEQFNDLLVLHVSKYLSTKDDGRADLAALDAEEKELLEVFRRHLAHENYAVKARYGHRARMVAPGPAGFGGE